MTDEGNRFSEADHPFTIKPFFSTLHYIIENSRPASLISFIAKDSIRHLLGFNPLTKIEKSNKSPN